MIEMFVSGFVLGFLLSMILVLRIMNRYNKKAMDLAFDALDEAWADCAELLKADMVR